MTSVYKETLECAVCGTVDDYTYTLSGRNLGSYHLDYRPAAGFIHHLPFGVHCCSRCHYCAFRVSEASTSAQVIIASAAYIAQIHSVLFPKLANYYLCSAMIQESDDDVAGAGWASVRAAWVCDDMHLTRAADKCRYKAIERFEWARSNGYRVGAVLNVMFATGQIMDLSDFVPPSGIDCVIMADLARRSGRFITAQRYCEEGLRIARDPNVKAILYFARDKAREFDRDVYSLDNVKTAYNSNT